MQIRAVGKIQKFAHHYAILAPLQSRSVFDVAMHKTICFSANRFVEYLDCSVIISATQHIG